MVICIVLSEKVSVYFEKNFFLDYIGTYNDILNKIMLWFPEMSKANLQIKTIIESILNSTA